MRRFRDSRGGEWDVVLGRESWGTLLALFVPVAGVGARQAPLSATAYDVGMQELEQLSDAALQALLERSTVKENEP